MPFSTKKIFSNVSKLCNDHKPEIETGIGIGLMLGGTVLAVKATIKVVRKIDEIKREKGIDEIPTKEVIKMVWKDYIPAVAATGLGSACVACSTKEGIKKSTLFATAYQATETAFDEYKEKVSEVVGKTKEKAIENMVIQDNMKPASSTNIIDTHDGTTLCYDYWSGRYFYSDIDTIKRQINRVNEQMLHDGFDGEISLNDVYYALGLPPAGTGEEIGWRTDWGIIEIDPDSMLTDDDRPVFLLKFRNPPKYGFRY